MEDNEGLIEGEQARRASSIRFKTVKVDKILYRDQIDPEFMRVPMPESIRKNRNIAIYFNYIQFACCVAALVYYRKRRVLIRHSFDFYRQRSYYSLYSSSLC